MITNAILIVIQNLSEMVALVKSAESPQTTPERALRPRRPETLKQPAQKKPDETYKPVWGMRCKGSPKILFSIRV